MLTLLAHQRGVAVYIHASAPLDSAKSSKDKKVRKTHVWRYFGGRFTNCQKCPAVFFWSFFGDQKKTWKADATALKNTDG